MIEKRGDYEALFYALGPVSVRARLQDRAGFLGPCATLRISGVWRGGAEPKSNARSVGRASGSRHSELGTCRFAVLQQSAGITPQRR
tara:strand:- start:1423 stop:1683 length:261 start_codon:yes stop_codon:yes gene_type:complete